MKYLITALLALPLFVATAWAENPHTTTPAQQAPAATTTFLGPVVVAATRTRQPVLDTAASISVISSKEIENTLTTNISQMVRYMPGISVPNDPTRFGRQGFNIRGIGGNRVKILLDGVPIPDGFSIGNLSNGGRDFVDTSVLKRVEIIRGPASSLYGSEAVGGVVNFITKDPGDYLTRTNGTVYFGLGTGWSSADNGLMGSGTIAFGDHANQGMVLFTRRQGHEFQNQGSVDTRDSSRTIPNPQHYQSNNLLTKGVFHRGWGKLTLAFGAHHGDRDTDVLSTLATVDYSDQVGFPYLIATESMTGHDMEDRARGSATLDFNGPENGWFQNGTAMLYWQYGNTQQNTLERQKKTIRSTATAHLISRRFTFSQHTAGGSFTLRSALGGDVKHLLVYGLDIEHKSIAEMRDGWQKNLATGDVSSTVGPDTFPVRDFPLSTTLEAGLFVEDRIAFAEGDFLLVPGLRYDYYRLDAENDPVFAQTSNNTMPTDLSDSSLSPRLGAIYKLTDSTSLFAQYAYGFRAPSYSAVNVGFTNLQFGYTAIPNPNLKPETSNAIELGIKHFGSAGSFTVSAYYERFNDFIEPFVSLGVNPDTGLLTFQSQNIGGVTIYGIEAHGTLGLDFIVPGLRIDGALAWGVGNDDETNQPLNSVMPPEAVVGLGYRAPNGRWGLQLLGTFVRAKTRVNESVASQFKTPGYATLDLLGNIHLTGNMKLVVGLFNLTDRKYWRWSSVRGRPAGDPLIDRFSQPGFNVGASLHMYW